MALNHLGREDGKGWNILVENIWQFKYDSSLSGQDTPPENQFSTSSLLQKLDGLHSKPIFFVPMVCYWQFVVNTNSVRR